MKLKDHDRASTLWKLKIILHDFTVIDVTNVSQNK